MSEITYGGEGTELIIVSGTTVDEAGNLKESDDVTSTAYYLGYQDSTGTFFMWHVPESEIKNITDLETDAVGFTLRRTIQEELPHTLISLNEFNNLSMQGSLYFAGNYTQLDSERQVSPLDGFIEDMKKISDTLYWWKDPQYLRIVQENYAETGKYDLNPAQMATFLSKYNLSQAEYNAAIERATDTKGWKTKKQTYYDQVKDMAIQLGGNITDAAADYAAEQWANGVWGTTKVTQQVTQSVDSYANFTLDKTFEALLGDDRQISTKETEVQNLLDEYLPEYMHTQFDVKVEAGKLRNIGGYKNELIESLKNKRFADFSMYDKDIKWQDILSTNLSNAATTWGITPDVNDPAILEAIKLNDFTKAKELYKKVGLERGYQSTVNSFIEGLSDAFGQGIVRSSNFLEGR